MSLCKIGLLLHYAYIVNRTSSLPYALRIVNSFTAFVLAFTSTASGIKAISEDVTSNLLQMMRRPTGAYTDVPTQVVRGKKPSRDAQFRAGKWNDHLLSDLSRIDLARKLEWSRGEYSASLLGEPMQVGGGGTVWGGV